MNRKIIIDAGHGGSDFGVSGNNLNEKDISLSISKYIYNKLKGLGYDVSLVRNSDIDISDDDRIARILNIYGNNSDIILISNHFDSNTNEAQIIYALRNTSGLPNLIYDELIKTGLEVKEPYQLRLPSNTALDYYYIHRNSGNLQPILIQYGNLSNSSFSRDIGNNYTKYGDALVSAISAYLGSNNNFYEVVGGDTLYSIARKFNTTVSSIKSLNNLSSNFLTVGQRLIIPSTNDSNISNDTYIVKKGDTLYSIAKRFDTNVNELLRINNLTSSFLTVGQSLLVPSSNYSNLYIVYKVKKGDTLYSLSNKYGVSVSDIMNFNGLKTNLLSIDQVLKIPALNDSNIQNDIYIVKKGDTLYSIAKDFNTTVDSIKTKNNLSNNNLSIGQKLIL